MGPDYGTRWKALEIVDMPCNPQGPHGATSSQKDHDLRETRPARTLQGILPNYPDNDEEDEDEDENSNYQDDHDQDDDMTDLLALVERMSTKD